MDITPTIEPTAKQYEAWQYLLDNTTYEVMFGGGAGGGKTWLFCEWLLTSCYRYPKTKWFIAREELKRIMGSTFMTWGKVCAHHNIPQSDWKINGQYNYIEFINGAAKGSRIDLLELKKLPSDPLFERFGSSEYTGGFFEEAGEIDLMAFEVLSSRCGRQMNKEYNIIPKVGISANPTKNWIYDRFYKPWKKGILPADRAFIQSLYRDNPYTAEVYGHQLDKISNLSVKRRLRDGDWDYDDESGVFRRVQENIESCFRPAELNKRYIMGVDLARVADYTVISVFDLHTHKQVHLERFNQIDWSLQKAKIEATARRYNNAKIRIDATGVGDPICEDLTKAGLTVEPFKFTAESKKNLIENMVILLEQDKIKLGDDPDQTDELISFAFTWNDTQKTVRYSAPSGKHDDIVCADALAVWQLGSKLPDPVFTPNNNKYKVQIKFNKFGQPII